LDIQAFEYLEEFIVKERFDKKHNSIFLPISLNNRWKVEKSLTNIDVYATLMFWDVLFIIPSGLWERLSWVVLLTILFWVDAS